MTPRNGGMIAGLPNEWEARLLHEVAEIRSGVAKNSNIEVDDPISVHYLRVANVQDGYLDLSEMSKIEISRNNLTRFAVLPGDVLMNEGGDLDQLGRGALWRGQYSPCVHQNHVFVVRCGHEITPEFLSHWTGSETAKSYFLVGGKQTTNLASINKTALGLLPVAVPPLAEQIAIADALSDVDALLGGLDKMLAKKRDLKQAAMQQLLTGQTRLPGFSGEWVTRSLKSIVQTPITDGPHMTPKFVEQGVPFLSVNNLVNNQIDLTDLRYITRDDDVLFSKKCKPQKGDVLLGKAASVGKVAVVEDDFDFNVWSPIALIRPRPEYNPHFVYYQLQSRSLIRQIAFLTNSSSQGNIGMGDIEKLTIEFPTGEEQTAIAEVLSDMDAEIAALERRREKTQDLKQGMMQELLTGKTRLI